MSGCDGSFLFPTINREPPSPPSKNSAPSPRQRKTVPIPTLAKLCVSTISSKIERYPPECLGVLSDFEWESICKLRHLRTCPRGGGQKKQTSSSSLSPSLQQAKQTGRGLDGTGRMAPAISDKIMKAIEDANPHLATSEVTDSIIWKDCVEYKFRVDGPSRPPALRYPWPILVERVKKAGTDLLELLKPPSSTSEGDGQDEEGADEANEKLRLQQAMSLDKCIKILLETPMTVPLLTASNVGKSVSKFIKNANKMKGATMVNIVDVWTPRRLMGVGGVNAMREEPPIQRLEGLLAGWKDVASAKGVTIRHQKSSSEDGAAGEMTGKNKRTSQERHEKDLSLMKSCTSWRELHARLVEREAEMMVSHGQRMRKIRDDLDANKKKIAKVTVRARGQRQSAGGMGMGMTAKVAKREAILSGQRGLRAMSSSSTSSSTYFGSRGGGGGKLQQLRRETKVAATFSKGGTSSFTKVSKGGFANSIANASSSTAGMKRKASALRKSSGQQHLMSSSGFSSASGGGKKVMKLPKAAGVGRGEVAFSSLRQQRDKQRKTNGGSSAGRSFRR